MVRKKPFSVLPVNLFFDRFTFHGAHLNNNALPTVHYLSVTIDCTLLRIDRRSFDDYRFRSYNRYRTLTIDIIRCLIDYCTSRTRRILAKKSCVAVLTDFQAQTILILSRITIIGWNRIFRFRIEIETAQYRATIDHRVYTLHTHSGIRGMFTAVPVVCEIIIYSLNNNFI